MKLVEVICDEWYPVFSLWEHNEPKDYTVEIPNELWERWVKLESEFENLQLLLEQYYKPRKWETTEDNINELSADSF